MQMNQFLPIFLCSVNLVFYKLFFCSSLPLSVHHVCSASTRSVILFCFNSFYHSALLHVFFIICYTFLSFISHCASSQSHTAHALVFPFLQLHLFSYRTTNHTQSVSFYFMHTPMAVQLPIFLGKRKTTVRATETPTETLTDLQS